MCCSAFLHVLISFISGVCVVYFSCTSSSPSSQACFVVYFSMYSSPSSQACVVVHSPILAPQLRRVLYVFPYTHPFISGVCCSAFLHVLISFISGVCCSVFLLYSSPSSQACVVVHFSYTHLLHLRRVL